jgi:type I restriction enzyme S subunit
MSEWKEYCINDVCLKVTSGGTPLTSKPEYYENGTIPWLKTTEIHKEVIWETNTLISENGLKNSSAKLIPENSIIIAMYGDEGTAGNVAITKIPLTTNQACCNLIIDHSITDYKFLYYYLKVCKQLLINLKTGGSQQNLNANTIKKFPVILPELAEQYRIASILSSYDELIENNNRRIAVLEQMAEQIYKEWFVRLRFPGYENTEFEKGVPKGWEVKSIKDFGNVVTGKTPSTSNIGYFGGKIPFIKTPDMHGNIFVIQTEETLTEDGFNSQKSQMLPANSICVSCIGTGGIVSITPAVCMTNQQINSLILKNQMELEFLFFTFRGLKTMIEMFGSTGATMTNLSKGKFENLKLIKPKDEFIERFCLLTKPMLNEIRILSQQQITLKQTRDLLLPRLISGKLRVKEAEMELEKI